MAKYYARRLRWGDVFGEEFWRVDEGEAYRIDVTSSSGTSRFQRQPGEPVKTTLERIMRGGEWYKLYNKPGEFFPRMARPDGINKESPGRNPDVRDEFQYYRARSAGQLHAFVEELDHICRVIQPEGHNLCAFGHATRNILILACTEVEAHWKIILKDNDYKSKKRSDRLDTTDYVQLLDAMRLDQYVVSFNNYPWLPTFVPFDGWRCDHPTTSLPWYHAYNQVKHDREQHFSEATLSRALTAVAACFVMLCAQYGWDFARQGNEGEREFFRLMAGPNWAPSEIYVPPFGEEYKMRHYPFTKSIRE